MKKSVFITLALSLLSISALAEERIFKDEPYFEFNFPVEIFRSLGAFDPSRATKPVEQSMQEKGWFNVEVGLQPLAGNIKPDDSTLEKLLKKIVISIDGTFQGYGDYPNTLSYQDMPVGASYGSICEDNGYNKCYPCPQNPRSWCRQVSVEGREAYRVESQGNVAVGVSVPKELVKGTVLEAGAMFRVHYISEGEISTESVMHKRLTIGPRLKLRINLNKKGTVRLVGSGELGLLGPVKSWQGKVGFGFF